MRFNFFKNAEIEEINIDKSAGLNGFKNSMDFANEIIKYEEKEDQIRLLDYILSTVKKDLKYSLLTEIIYKEKYKSINLLRKVVLPQKAFNDRNEEINCICKNLKMIDIREDDIIVVPWDIKRKSSSIKYLSNQKFQFQDNNHMGIYYEGIDLVYIYNGLHSISAGIELNKEGKIYIEEIVDIRKLYSHIYTDGVYWYNTHTNEKIDDVFDFRIAIIYEVSKMKNIIENGE